MLYSFFNTMIKGYLKYRKHRISQMMTDPIGLQNDVLQRLLADLKNTSYGQRHGVSSIKSLQDYKKGIPIIDYEVIREDILFMMDGKENVLWPDKVHWFAKSSGTTSDRSKFIPITDDNLFENHVSASWDAMAILYANQKDARVFDKKNLIMGGSLNHSDKNIVTGDISAILLHRMPSVGRPFYTPDFETALMADWEKKIEIMAHQCAKEDVAMSAFSKSGV